MVSLIFMILFILTSVGIFAFSIYKAIGIVKFPMPKTLEYPKIIKKFLYFISGLAVSIMALFVFLAMWQNYPMKGGDWAQLIVGSLIFGFALPCFVLSFILHYYGKEIDPKSDKTLYISIFVGGIASLFGLLFITNGVADYIPYPLVNGINFKQGFVTPLDKVESLGQITPNLAWYALCILTGAVLVLVICDHRFYKEYGKHGILESTFFVAFPAGIVGARVGFVVGEWYNKGFNVRVANGEWWSIFAVWEGGLTVISGALTGIIVGVLWFIWRNKKYSIWLAVDVIVPCILVAQAIGRWGNFFNCEVHGDVVDASNWWFLPKIVLNNSQFSEGAMYNLSHYATGLQTWVANPSQIWAPLFYVEFLTNLVGYFFIRFALGKGLKKYLELGDLAFMYIVWYGFTRVIMEPMRCSKYNMGSDGYYSWIWSICFVIIGCALIAGNHIVRYILRKVKNKEITYKEVNVPMSLTVSILIGVIGITLTTLGIIFMTSSTQSAYVGFNRYNNGLIMLSLGLSVILLLSISITYLLQGRKRNAE